MKNEWILCKNEAPRRQKDFMEVSSRQQTKGERAQKGIKPIYLGNGLVLWTLEKSDTFLRRNSI
jgi:hypothetical protein